MKDTYNAALEFGQKQHILEGIIFMYIYTLWNRHTVHMHTYFNREGSYDALKYRLAVLE